MSKQIEVGGLESIFLPGGVRYKFHQLKFSAVLIFKLPDMKIKTIKKYSNMKIFRAQALWNMGYWERNFKFYNLYIDPSTKISFKEFKTKSKDKYVLSISDNPYMKRKLKQDVPEISPFWEVIISNHNYEYTYESLCDSLIYPIVEKLTISVEDSITFGYKILSFDCLNYKYLSGEPLNHPIELETKTKDSIFLLKQQHDLPVIIEIEKENDLIWVSNLDPVFHHQKQKDLEDLYPCCYDYYFRQVSLEVPIFKCLFVTNDSNIIKYTYNVNLTGKVEDLRTQITYKLDTSGSNNIEMEYVDIIKSLDMSLEDFIKYLSQKVDGWNNKLSETFIDVTHLESYTNLALRVYKNKHYGCIFINSSLNKCLVWNSDKKILRVSYFTAF